MPGWGDSSASFTGLAALLKDKYQIYVLDLPGFGGTQAPPQAWGLEDYADFLEAWIKKLDLKPFALAGHSYGGAVAITAAGRRKIAGKLILLASAGIRGRQPVRKKLLAAGAKAGKVPLALLPASSRQRIKARLYGSIGSDLMLLPHMEQTFRRIINQDVAEDARRIKLPTLLIYGTADKATPPAYGQILNGEIAGSRLEIIEAGHFLHQDQPQKTAQLVEDFLEEKNV